MKRRRRRHHPPPRLLPRLHPRLYPRHPHQRRRHRHLRQEGESNTNGKKRDEDAARHSLTSYRNGIYSSSNAPLVLPPPATHLTVITHVNMTVVHECIWLCYAYNTGCRGVAACNIQARVVMPPRRLCAGRGGSFSLFTCVLFSAFSVLSVCVLGRFPQPAILLHAVEEDTMTTRMYICVCCLRVLPSHVTCQTCPHSLRCLHAPFVFGRAAPTSTSHRSSHRSHHVSHVSHGSVVDEEVVPGALLCEVHL